MFILAFISILFILALVIFSKTKNQGVQPTDIVWEVTSDVECRIIDSNQTDLHINCNDNNILIVRH